MTKPQAERRQERRIRDGGWDDAILVWNGMVTDALRGDYEAAHGDLRERAGTAHDVDPVLRRECDRPREVWFSRWRNR